jgi:hypothetical protein
LDHFPPVFKRVNFAEDSVECVVPGFFGLTQITDREVERAEVFSGLNQRELFLPFGQVFDDRFDSGNYRTSQHFVAVFANC